MGETFQAINPANEEVLALARKATKVDLARAEGIREDGQCARSTHVSGRAICWAALI
jgi:hypothetical protein